MKKASYPYILWLGIFILLPLVLILCYAFSVGNKMDLSGSLFSLANIKRFFNPIFMMLLYRSLKLAFISTIICLLLGYPLAYFMSKESPRTRNTLILAFVIPMWMNFLLRTYSWVTLLGRNGLLNKLLLALGLGTQDIMYTNTAVLIGMVYNFLPFMVLSIYSVLLKMDKNLIEAAEDLGANKYKVFSRITLPLSVPGIITGINMVFIPAVSTFVISNLLGGNKYNLIGNVIEQQFRFTLDWHFGSAISFILMLIILVAMTFTVKFDKTIGEEGAGGLW